MRIDYNAPRMEEWQDEIPADDAEIEIYASMMNLLYFIAHYVFIFEKAKRQWLRFRLWPEQARVAMRLVKQKKVIILKARQLGLTWLVLAYILWQMLFHPVALVLITNAREEEAKDALRRIKGMYERLPTWMKRRFPVQVDNETYMQFATGSSIRAIPPNRGDSYPATHVIADEMSLIEQQEVMMEKIGPTIEDGGQFIGIMRANKAKPNCLAHRIYLDARDKRSDWDGIFLGWYAHPGRSLKWYKRVQRDHASEPDYMPGQYPANDGEALAQRQSNKRIQGEWLNQVYYPADPIFRSDDMGAYEGKPPKGSPALPALTIYQLPVPNVDYCIGVDGAEGLPTSDDTAIEVVRADTLEQVARLIGKFDSGVTADYVSELASYYNDAYVMIENISHGYAVIEIMQRDYEHVRLLSGPGVKPDRKLGWTQSEKGKKTLYNLGAKKIYQQEVIIHNLTTKAQLGNVNADTLLAPPGDHDDDADAYLLAIVGADYIDKIQESSWGRVRRF